VKENLYEILNASDFVPSYKNQVLPPWEESKWMVRSRIWGLTTELKLEKDGKKINKVKINNPLQVPFVIPKLDNRRENFRFSKSDTVETMYSKISSGWPGKRGRDFVYPKPNQIRLFLGEKQLILSLDQTVESIGLYFLALDHVLSIDFDLDSLPQSEVRPDRKGNSGQSVTKETSADVKTSEPLLGEENCTQNCYCS
jgi:hypothetical protein